MYISLGKIIIHTIYVFSNKRIMKNILPEFGNGSTRFF